MTLQLGSYLRAQMLLAAIVALVMGMLIGGALQRYLHGQNPNLTAGKAGLVISQLTEADSSREVELGVGTQEEGEELDAASAQAHAADSASVQASAAAH